MMEQIMTEFDMDIIANTTSMRRLMRLFIVSTLAIGLGVGGWATVTKIDSAIVASGTFVVESSAQAVQHLEGGVVGAILVKDGELVQEGQVLVRLDAAKVIADSSISQRKMLDLCAQKARLEAERLGQPQIDPSTISNPLAKQSPDLRQALSAQQNILTERLSTRRNQLSQLDEHKRQIETQIEGLNQQHTALQEEYAQASADLADQRMLDSKGLIRRPVLRQTEREVSRLRGEIGDTEARTASARSQLVEAQFKIDEVTRNALAEVLAQLQTVTEQLAQVEQEYNTSKDRLQRLEIRAPRAGYVHELAVHTVGGIVAPGQTLMSIIPNTGPLLLTAKILPEDVDQVHIGQDATVRISAFKLPVTPELESEVINLSPDRIVDNSGQPYFVVKVAVAPGELTKLQGKELTPGLPAEVMIRGEARRVITYLTQPLMEKLTHAFREK
jgi:HlyD family secretion protein